SNTPAQTEDLSRSAPPVLLVVVLLPDFSLTGPSSFGAICLQLAIASLRASSRVFRSIPVFVSLDPWRTVALDPAAPSSVMDPQLPPLPCGLGN
ncbi:hypothetical protein BVRB_028490, partial [Beta vulgaris subsp. vulgaris]